MDGPPPLSAADILEHEAFVRGLARAALGADDQVDDVVQETLTAGLTRRGGAVRNVRAWLTTVTRRRSVDVLRREVTRRRHEQAVSRAAVRTTPAPEEILAHEEARRALVEELVALDPPSREVLVLRYFEDLPPREIAARLNVPVETVRTRTKRALARLRERLDARHGGDRSRWSVPLAGAVGFASTAAVVSSTSAGFVPWLVGGAAVLALGVGAFHVLGAGEAVHDAPALHLADAAPADRPRLEGSGRALEATPVERGTGRILGWVTRNGHPAPATVEIRRAPGIGAAEIRADVWYRDSSPGDASIAPLERRTTDARGGYAVDDLPQGVYGIRAVLASGTTGETSVRIQFEGQAVSGDVRLWDGPHVVTGRVVDAAGAPVVARVACTGPVYSDEAHAERPPVYTDAEGRFTVAGVAEGECYLSATAVAGGGNSPSERTYVPPGGPITLSLRPPFAPDPTQVRGRVDGTVLDPEGRPVVGVRVESEWCRELTERLSGGPIAITDAAGRFVLEGLGVGFVRLVVHDRGWSTPGLRDARDGADPLLVATDLEGRATAPLRVVRTGALRGTVRDADGSPVAGAFVHVSENCFGSRDTVPAVACVTGADGRFVVDTLLADMDCEIEASSPELAFPVALYVRSPLEGDLTVELVGQRLDPSRWVEVEVREASTNAPVKDAFVAIRSAEREDLVGPSPAGSDGRVLMGPLPAGPLEVEVSGPGIADGTRRPATFPSSLITVERAPFVKGRVSLPRGREAMGVELFVEAVDPGDSLPVELHGWEDRVGMDGRFVLSLRPGRWRLRATDDSREPPLAGEAIVEPGDHEVLLELKAAPAPPAPDDDDEPGPKNEWRVRVLDAAGAPVAKATVAVWFVSPEEWEWESFEVGADGKTYAYAGDPANAWFEARDLKDALGRPLPLAPALAGAHDLARGGGAVELRVESEKHIRGVVRDAAGARVRGAHVLALARWPGMVSVHPTALAKHGRVLTDAEGRFDLPRLADLEYELRLVVPRAFVPPDGGSVVRAGATDVTLVVASAVAPVVTVLDERGEPVAGVRIKAIPIGRKLERHQEDDDLPGMASTTTDAAGRARLPGLAPGRACVLTTESVRVFDTRIDAWQPADTTVRVRTIHAIAGRVLGPDGRPLARADVRAEDGRHSATADAEGRFELRGLEAGSHRLFARHGEMPKGEPVEASAGAADVVLRAERGLDFEVRIADWTHRWTDTNGQVVDAAGKPLAGGGGSRPDENGVLRWEGYPPGSRLSFRLRTKGGTHVVVAKDVLVGEPTTAHLEPGAPIRGRLLGPGGTVPANAGVSAADADGRSLHVDLESDGRFVIEGVRAGERVRVTGWGGPRDAQRQATWITRLTDVEGGTTLDLEVRPP